ncbi:hypothetical protein [Agromyces mangrovi Wang et al. 2018]|uniref:hypothetical protein n=1 Tax=Agromyces mangrovi TaxID=1858653 RepID=UPI002574667A|nr:hypothetical protein [Agromyces mangrovi]
MARRPGGVTFVAILTWIGGFFDVLAGALVLLFGTDPDLAEAAGGERRSRPSRSCRSSSASWRSRSRRAC